GRAEVLLARAGPRIQSVTPARRAGRMETVRCDSARAAAIRLDRASPVRSPARFAKFPRAIPDRRTRRRKWNGVADRRFAARKYWRAFWESSSHWKARKRVQRVSARREWFRHSKQRGEVHRVIAGASADAGPFVPADRK